MLMKVIILKIKIPPIIRKNNIKQVNGKKIMEVFKKIIINEIKIIYL
jgi:hypothetical protein